MEDFYLNYEKTDIANILVKTNLTDKMLQCRNEYEKDNYLMALSVVLEKINETGDEGKSKFKMMCEENGMIFYNAFRIIKNLGNDLIDRNLGEYLSFYYDILDTSAKRIERKIQKLEL